MAGLFLLRLWEELELEVGSINFSHAHFPVLSLGYGRRVGIWLQGCSLRCAGCIVPQSWEIKVHHRVGIARLVDRLEPWLARCQGITVSGGEPFDQPEALQQLLEACRTRFRGDVIVYSGYPWEYLQRFSDILALVDVVIPEPFVIAEPTGHPLMGSNNQKIHCLTELGRQRYAMAGKFSRGLDAAPARETIRLAGVPRPQDMKMIKKSLNQAGIPAASKR